MICSWRRVLNGLAIALLLFVIACQVQGAIAGSARLLSVVVSIVCVLCCVGLYRDIAKVRTLTGCLLIILAAGVALVAWRLHMPVLIAGIICGVFAAVGAGLIAAHRTRRANGKVVSPAKP